jgi:CRISPR/Cas system-associated exonuclease Cas4 (RecB family)
MQIMYRPDMVVTFADIMMADFKEESAKRTGFHRSDAISCPLKCYWRMTGEIEGVFTSDSVGILLIGTLTHLLIHKNFDAQEKVFDLDGMNVTVDAILGKLNDSPIDYPIESKTTRKTIRRKEDIPVEWIEQLSIAMSVMGVNKGYLMIINLVSFDIAIWEFTINEVEREMFLKAAIFAKREIEAALKSKRPDLLTPKHEDCKYCIYRPLKNREGGCPWYQAPKEESTR